MAKLNARTLTESAMGSTTTDGGNYERDTNKQKQQLSTLPFLKKKGSSGRALGT